MLRQKIIISKLAPTAPAYNFLRGAIRYCSGYYIRGNRKYAITWPAPTGIRSRIDILAKYIDKAH